MLIAVTLYDEVNMTACQVAHSIFNVPTKIDSYTYTCSTFGSYCTSYSVPTWQLQGRDSDADAWTTLDDQNSAYPWVSSTAATRPVSC